MGVARRTTLRRIGVGVPVVSGCTYVDCRVPPERHDHCAAEGLGKCWGVLEHQHVPKRSQTPRDERECPVRLCQGHHGAIDNGGKYEGFRMEDKISEWDGDSGPRRMYQIVNRKDGAILRSFFLDDPKLRDASWEDVAYD